jgi:probable phosphoglycerate mutase
MTTTRLCLIRHGETTWNAERRLQGHIDIPLNAKGEVQARQMAQALKDAKLAFDVLYTSDLKRASDTANAVVQLFGVQAKVESTLRERHKDFRLVRHLC